MQRIYGGVVIGILGAGLYVWWSPTPAAINHAATADVNVILPNADQFLLPVAGTVQAVDTVVVSAKTAGVVTAVRIDEGDRVTQGEHVMLVHDARAAAEVQVNDAVGVLDELSALSRSIQADIEKANAQTQYNEAYALASLTAAADDRRLSEADDALQRVLTTARVSIPNTLRYVQDNRTLFTADSLVVYRQVVRDLYGRDVDFMRVGNIAYGGIGADIFATLERATTTDGRLTAARDLVQIIDQVLFVYEDSESEVYDRARLTTTDARFGEYTLQRQQLVGLQQTVMNIVASYQTVMDQTAITDVQQGSAVSRAAATATGTRDLAAVATESAAATMALSAARVGVANTMYELGDVTVPVDGVVSAVYVTTGQYVLPATPLVRIVGDGARELQVSLPAVLAPLVATGTPYLLAGETVGYVTSVVPEARGAGYAATIMLTRELVVGSTIAGHLQLDLVAAERYRSIDRAFMQFTPQGPLVVTQAGRQIMVRIVADAGDMVLVELAEASTDALVPQFGVALVYTP